MVLYDSVLPMLVTSTSKLNRYVFTYYRLVMEGLDAYTLLGDIYGGDLISIVPPHALLHQRQFGV